MCFSFASCFAWCFCCVLCIETNVSHPALVCGGRNKHAFQNEKMRRTKTPTDKRGACTPNTCFVLCVCAHTALGVCVVCVCAHSPRLRVFLLLGVFGRPQNSFRTRLPRRHACTSASRRDNPWPTTSSRSSSRRCQVLTPGCGRGWLGGRSLGSGRTSTPLPLLLCAYTSFPPTHLT